MNNDIPELKACPFCNNANVRLMSAWTISEKDSDDFAVCCPLGSKGCGATGRYSKDEAEAVGSWNTRAPEWISVETTPIPEEGNYLVMVAQNENRKGRNRIHVAEMRKNISVVGQYFDFDMPAIIRWQPLPYLPKPTEGEQ